MNALLGCPSHQPQNGRSLYDPPRYSGRGPRGVPHGCGRSRVLGFAATTPGSGFSSAYDVCMLLSRDTSILWYQVAHELIDALSHSIKCPQLGSIKCNEDPDATRRCKCHIAHEPWHAPGFDEH